MNPESSLYHFVVIHLDTLLNLLFELYLLLFLPFSFLLQLLLFLLYQIILVITVTNTFLSSRLLVYYLIRLFLINLHFLFLFRLGHYLYRFTIYLLVTNNALILNNFLSNALLNNFNFLNNLLLNLLDLFNLLIATLIFRIVVLTSSAFILFLLILQFQHLNHLLFIFEVLFLIKPLKLVPASLNMQIIIHIAFLKYADLHYLLKLEHLPYIIYHPFITDLDHHQNQ